MRKHWPFLVVLAASALVRATLLCVSQTHVHSDEAVIGLMGKHVLEGRYFPFYMYGQPYNAGAALESYLATIPFSIFGVGVIPLKSVIVVLSLAVLVCFYRMTDALYDRRTALAATFLFVLSPSLLKWHFQVRGYSWYFLAIPILTGLFFAIASASAPKATRVFLFGLASGLTVWNLELALSLVGAFWVVLVLRRRLSAKSAMAGVAGLAAGYAPAVVFNLTHHFSNWEFVFAGKTSLDSIFRPATYLEILSDELPKFFGADTTLWYYPETPAIGYLGYAVASTAVLVALFPFLTRRVPLQDVWRGDLSGRDELKDMILVVLTLACFVPYVAAPFRVPGYFLGGIFFLSMLGGRLAARSLAASALPHRLIGGAVLAGALLAGSTAIAQTARRNQIETLTEDQEGHFYLTRFPGGDIDAVERRLKDEKIHSVWTTVSFVYPLLFESGETLAISDAIFGWGRPIYPATVPRLEPSADEPQAFVLETNSPYRAAVTARCAQAAGGAPLSTSCGSFVVIEARAHR